jgi:hypothetical protein
MTGKRQNMHGFERKRAKQAERRRPHQDKYTAAQQPDDQLAALAEHFQSEERARERR